MPFLVINIENIEESLLDGYDFIEIRRYSKSDNPLGLELTDELVESYFIRPNGKDVINNINNINAIKLNSLYTTYYFDDTSTEGYDYYIYSLVKVGAPPSYSGWSEVFSSETQDYFYTYKYPRELVLTSQDYNVVNSIRILIGDVERLERLYGSDVSENILSDKKTIRLPNKGWPSCINICGKPYNLLINPSVNGYRFLRFIDLLPEYNTHTKRISGCSSTSTLEIESGIDIWYKIFRFSDREILNAYNSLVLPSGLTPITTTLKINLLITAIKLLRSELLQDLTESGASIKDDVSSYNPEPGLKYKKELIDTLNKELEDEVRVVTLAGLRGVRID